MVHTGVVEVGRNEYGSIGNVDFLYETFGELHTTYRTELSAAPNGHFVDDFMSDFEMFFGKKFRKRIFKVSK